MNKTLIFTLIFLIGILTLTGFKEEAENFFIPKIRLYGTSTYWADSTNYQVTNKGIYLQDSLKVGKDLYVGVKGGKVYLDTNRSGQIYYTGLSMVMSNSKANGYMHFATNQSFVFNQDISGSLSEVAVLDTNGFNLKRGNIYLDGGTQQIKLPSDTASDYNTDDAVTIDRQSGTITTKSLTTASGSVYTITVTNSLCLAGSKVFATIGGYGGAGVPIIYIVDPANGSFAITLVNSGGASLNAVAVISYVLFN